MKNTFASGGRLERQRPEGVTEQALERRVTYCVNLISSGRREGRESVLTFKVPYTGWRECLPLSVRSERLLRPRGQTRPISCRQFRVGKSVLVNVFFRALGFGMEWLSRIRKDLVSPTDK